MIVNLKKLRAVPFAFLLLASCSMPSSNDGQQRVLTVANNGSSPIIALYAGRPGTTPGSRQATLELLSSNAEGMVDFLPLANIPAGSGRKFNIDDGNGTCVFEFHLKFLDGVSRTGEGDVCKMTREGAVLIASN